jgi:hypothetical protein
MKNPPVAGSFYGFANTAVKVYNNTIVGGAVKEAAKLKCSRKMYFSIYYIALCTMLLASDFACFTTGGNPLVVSCFVNCADCIVNEIGK